MSRRKKVVLFGRTGDGKSTLANALVTGGIRPEIFKASDAAKACTAEIQKETGRGWTVTDTVGLGESESVAVPNADSRQMLVDFLTQVKDEYSHIIYVKRANRITTLDEMIWLIFTSIFEGAEEAFVVVLTGASEEWLEENREKLPKYLQKHPILVVDLPPVHRLVVTERRRQATRKKSIQSLEDNLNRLFEERGHKYSTPDITKMRDPQLDQKARSLLNFIVDTIKRLYDKVSWKKIAAKFGILLEVADLVVNIVSLAS